MAHDTHASTHDAADGHPHPPLPTVQDEAGDTPNWVPALGLALLLLGALFGLVCAGSSTDGAAIEQAAE